MPRKRMIHPNLWEDPSFNKLTHGAKILFIGMISNADDEGYLRTDAASLKRLIFGFEDTSLASVEQMLSECKQHLKSLHFYTTNENEEFSHFINWTMYQKIQKDRIQHTLYPICSTCLTTAKQPLTELSKVSKLSKGEKNEKEENLKGREILKKAKEKLVNKLSSN